MWRQICLGNATRVARYATGLRACYALSGTDVAPYTTLYARPTRCPLRAGRRYPSRAGYCSATAYRGTGSAMGLRACYAVSGTDLRAMLLPGPTGYNGAAAAPTVHVVPAGAISYALATRSSLLTLHILLPAGAAGRRRIDAVCTPTALRAPYAVSSTEICYAATRTEQKGRAWVVAERERRATNIHKGEVASYRMLCDVRYRHSVCYAMSVCGTEIAHALLLLVMRGTNVAYGVRPGGAAAGTEACLPTHACYGMSGTNVAYQSRNRVRQLRKLLGGPTTPPPMILRACYAMSGTGFNCAPMRWLRGVQYWRGEASVQKAKARASDYTDVAAIVLPTCYAMCGTEIGDAGTHSLRTKLRTRCGTKLCYDTMRCAVLRQAMLCFVPYEWGAYFGTSRYQAAKNPRANLRTYFDQFEGGQSPGIPSILLYTTGMLSFYAYNARPTTLRSSYEMSGTKIAYAATRERGPCHVGVRFAARLVLRYDIAAIAVRCPILIQHAATAMLCRVLMHVLRHVLHYRYAIASTDTGIALRTHYAMSGTDIAYAALLGRSQRAERGGGGEGQSYAICLHTRCAMPASYAMSGTEIAYGGRGRAIWLCVRAVCSKVSSYYHSVCSAMSGTDIAYAATAHALRCALGTEIAYGAAACAMRCP
eukprot:3940264-Rhodomonas_salina.1